MRKTHLISRFGILIPFPCKKLLCMVDFVVVVALIHEGEALGKGVGVDTPGDSAVHEDLPRGEHVHR